MVSLSSHVAQQRDFLPCHGLYSLPVSPVNRIFQARTRVDCLFLLQGIFQTQGWNSHLLGLLHWQVDSLPLSLLEIRRWLGLHLKLPWKVKVKVAQSCPTLWTISPWNSLGQNTGVGSLTLLQGIFPTVGSEGRPRDERSVGLRARVQESEVPAGD